MPTYFDDLAAMRDGGRLRRTPHRDEQPFRRKLDADGSGLSIEAPGTRTLARVLVLPWLTATGREPFRPRSGAALLTRPTGSDEEPNAANVHALADELSVLLAAIPKRPDAGRPYNDVRLLATVADRRTVEEYTRAAIQHARRLAPPWSPPRPEKAAPGGPTLTDAERKRREREQYKRGAEIAARWWLEDALANGAADEVDEDEPALLPGVRIEAADLWRRAEADLPDFDGIADEEGTVARPPGRSTFYRVADEVLGRRVRINGARVYVIPAPPAEPEEADMESTDEIRDRTAAYEQYAEAVDRATAADERRALLLSGDYAGALTLQRYTHAATGTDGAVVDLDAARARRSR